MKFLLWFIIGIAAITGAFYLPGKGPDLWPNVNAAGIASAAYLTLLMGFILRKPIPAHTRAVSWVMFVILFCVITLGWRTAYTQSRFQREKLAEMGHTLGHAYLSDGMHHALLKTLDTYYKENALGAPSDHGSLKTLFLRSFPSATIGTDLADSLIPVLSADLPDTSRRVYVKTLDDSLIVLVGEAQLPGRNPAFLNFNGRKGRIQRTSSLTTKGLTDVIEN